MDSTQKSLSKKLGDMTSEEAAGWLLSNYPIDKPGYQDAITLITHRSWQRPEQLRLSRYYLGKLPFSSAKPYEAFASFMSIKLVLKVIEGFIPETDADRKLLLYHLRPVLQKSTRSDADRELVAAFISQMQ